MTDQTAYIALLERQIADLEAENGRLRSRLNDPHWMTQRALAILSGIRAREETEANSALAIENEQLRRELERKRAAPVS
jgi:regulator of replication initiation timing